MAGTVTVRNNTAEPGSDEYPNGVQIDAVIGQQRDTVDVGGSTTFQNVPSGRHTVNAQPAIVGMRSVSATVNVGDDFDTFLCTVTKTGTDLRMSVVSQ
jgi:hypothetical protein